MNNEVAQIFQLTLTIEVGRKQGADDEERVTLKSLQTAVQRLLAYAAQEVDEIELCALQANLNQILTS